MRASGPLRVVRRRALFLLFAGLAGCSSEQVGTFGATRAAVSDPGAASAERGLDGGAPVDPPWAVDSIAMATGADTHMVVWRTSPLTALRVRASDNTPLGSFAVGTETGPCKSGSDPLRPAIAFAGGLFLVTWTDGHDTTDTVCAVRVRPDGTVLDTPPLVLRGPDVGPGPIVGLGAGGNGTDFLVVWSETRKQSGTGVVSAKTVHASEGAASSGTTSDVTCSQLSSALAVATDGTGWLVVSSNQIPIRIEQRGGVLDTKCVTPSPGGGTGYAGSAPTVAFDGTSYQIVGIGQDTIWMGESSYDPPKLSRTRIRASDGMVLDLSPVDLVRGMADFLGVRSTLDPKLAFDGTNLAVLWRGEMTTSSPFGPNFTTDGLLLRMQRFTPTGQLLGPQVVVDSTSQHYQGNAFASAQGKFLAAWSGEYGVNRVQVASVEATGTVTKLPTDAWKAVPPQASPALSSDGRNVLLAFSEFTGTRWAVRAARLRDGDGELLGPVDLTAAGAGNQSAPAVTSNGTDHLVVWVDSGKVRAVRVRGDDGAVLDSPPLTLATTNAPRASVTYDGQDYLVWWSEQLPPDWQRLYVLRAVRVRGADGGIVDATPLELVSGVELAHLAFVKPYHVASYSDGYDNTSKPRSLYVRRFERDGKPVGEALRLATSAPSRVVPMGEQAMILWRDATLHAQRLRASDGALPDVAPIDLSASLPLPEAAAFDGANVLLAIPWGPSVRMARLTQTGMLLDPEGAVVADDPDWAEAAPALSVSSAGRSLVAYTRKVPGPGGASPRVRWRSVDTNFPPPPDGSADARDGGVVVDAAAGADATVPDAPAGPVSDAASPDAEPGADTIIADASAGATNDATTAIDVAPGAAADLAPGSAGDVAPEPVRDAGVDAASGSHGGCGCRVGETTSDSGGLALVSLLALVANHRRRRAGAQRRLRFLPGG